MDSSQPNQPDIHFDRRRQIEEHLAEVARLQAEETRTLLESQGITEHELKRLGIAMPVGLSAQAGDPKGAENTWPPKGFYWLFHVIVGMTLGIIGASVSLVANIVGASAVGKQPLELIRVYLTFPMGASALEDVHSTGKVVFIGCVLYLITGGLYGVAYQVLMKTIFKDASTLGARLAISTLIGLGLWLVNFYGILSWLQPTLLDGNWILSEIPFWVAMLTHLAFAWTLLAVSSFGSGSMIGDWSAFAPSPTIASGLDLTHGGDLGEAAEDAKLEN